MPARDSVEKITLLWSARGNFSLPVGNPIIEKSARRCMPREQKRHEGRMRLALPGEYCFTETDDWIPCRLHDLSAGGMSLDGKTSFYAGDKLQVRFILDKHMILVTLEITHLIGKKAGGRITQIAESDRRVIQEFLNRELMSGKIFFS